jgi:stress response protein YsnF/sporulation protein YlmC with PRC-barrel domain
MSGSKAEFIKNKTRINDLLEKLRAKLRSYAVINMRGQLIGRIEDFILNQSRQLNMVMSRSEAQSTSPLFLLSSRYIQKVDTPNRVLFVDLTQTELNQLPVYQPSVQDVKAVSEPLVIPPVTQVSDTSLENSETPLPKPESLTTEYPEELNNQTMIDDSDLREVVEEEIVRLLEERLVINRSKRKIGEVVVRKEIETRIVEVPVQREKLIIEQVGSETIQLAEIDLGHGEVTGVELRDASRSDSAVPQLAVPTSDNRPTVTGEFLSPKAASNLLEAIALQGRHGCAKVRVELVLDNPELQETYQKMFDRCSRQ